MSETAELQPSTATEPTPIVGFSVKPAPNQNRNGREIQTWEVTFAGRSAQFRKLSLGDMWGLLELSPGEMNSTWSSMASLAAAVTMIDGTPVPSPAGETISRREIRWVLDKVGMDGLMAVGEGLKQIDPAAATATDAAATAKN